MGSYATRGVSGWRTALKLGRVSNLPTVWSNVIAAAALAGGAPVRTLALIAGAMSLLYVGGMYLNDAFDADRDARERPERPIPSGEISAAAVMGAGFALLAAGVALLAAIDARTGIAGLALAGAIVLYDWHHKENALSPFVMGLCRALVYVTTGVAVAGAVSWDVLVPGLAILAYVAGLTYAARMEAFDRVGSFWPLALLAAPLLLALPQIGLAPLNLIALAALIGCGVWVWKLLSRRAPFDVSRAVGVLIAGIAINDALLAATTGAEYATLACLVCFGLTLVFQRYVAAS